MTKYREILRLSGLGLSQQNISDSGNEPLMYSQFCYHIQQDEQKRRATMHINRNPGEQIEVDWGGDPATVIDPNTGEILKAYYS